MRRLTAGSSEDQLAKRFTEDYKYEGAFAKCRSHGRRKVVQGNESNNARSCQKPRAAYAVKLLVNVRMVHAGCTCVSFMRTEQYSTQELPIETSYCPVWCMLAGSIWPYNDRTGSNMYPNPIVGSCLALSTQVLAMN
eukprot:IDg20648t1